MQWLDSSDVHFNKVAHYSTPCTPYGIWQCKRVVYTRLLLYAPAMSLMRMAHAPESKIDIEGKAGRGYTCHICAQLLPQYISIVLLGVCATYIRLTDSPSLCVSEPVHEGRNHGCCAKGRIKHPTHGCEIPPDIHFEIHDETGTMLGLLGGHKNLMALRTPVFKTMFFGALTEKGDTVQIKDTSLVAFKALLKHIHDDIKEDDW